MSDNKVALPREVVDAIDYARNAGYDNFDILRDYHSGGANEYIRGFIADDERNYDVLLSALVNGYTAEATPEEKVREYYATIGLEYADSDEGSYDEVYCGGQMQGITQTLALLGITIEGVNA